MGVSWVVINGNECFMEWLSRLNVGCKTVSKSH
jgi:hypothetical protein